MSISHPSTYWWYTSGNSAKFWGMSHHLSWSLVKKAQHYHYLLRRLKRISRCTPILKYFYRCVIENILTYDISVWYKSVSLSQTKAKNLHQVVYEKGLEHQTGSLKHLQWAVYMFITLHVYNSCFKRRCINSNKKNQIMSPN